MLSKRGQGEGVVEEELVVVAGGPNGDGGERKGEKGRRYVVRVWCESVFYGRLRVAACKDFNCGVKQRSHGCNDVVTGVGVSSWVK